MVEKIMEVLRRSGKKIARLYKPLQRRVKARVGVHTAKM